ncbi:hypothetical protein QN277_000534 [Acacia crassicarpa]|uniref:Uncharacterized protein n=1 Tax=Acacia crassicarpa TaxID=499986 RepID=A0AAE1N6D6_9FABA|nr:hypothetical protein QN277_000534 [Acacia crassicarpa]
MEISDRHYPWVFPSVKCLTKPTIAAFNFQNIGALTQCCWIPTEGGATLKFQSLSLLFRFRRAEQRRE